MTTETSLKLHLGCGQRHLDGYVNIDYPPAEHTVMVNPVADEFADIRQLRYAAGSVSEVRLHHVFEHFSRPQAAALAAGWASWLEPGGLLRIEVPDFDRTALAALLPWASRRTKAVAIRHLFGSHEAHWACHWEGWHRASLESLLQALGFQDIRFARRSWLGTHNLEVTGVRGGALEREAARKVIRAFLGDYLVDRGESESKLLEVWCGMADEQLEISWASG